MEVRLKVLVGKNAGHEIAIVGEKFLIGREEDCHLRPRSDLISRHHCALLIEGTYLVRKDSPYRSVADLDAPGRRILVTPKSAYDLYLARTLKHAELVRLAPPDAAELADVFARERLDAMGGVRQLIGKYLGVNPGLRLLPDSFMEIRQAMGTKPGRAIGARYLRAFVEEMKASGFVADALARSGQSASVAPPEV